MGAQNLMNGVAKECPVKVEGTSGNGAWSPEHGRTPGNDAGNYNKDFNQKTAKVGQAFKPGVQEEKSGEKDDVLDKNTTSSSAWTPLTTSSPSTSSKVETKPDVHTGGSQESSALAGTLTTLLKPINVNESVNNEVKKELPVRKLKMISVRKAVIGDVTTGLLDGGATNPLERNESWDCSCHGGDRGVSTRLRSTSSRSRIWDRRTDRVCTWSHWAWLWHQVVCYRLWGQTPWEG